VEGDQAVDLTEVPERALHVEPTAWKGEGSPAAPGRCSSSGDSVSTTSTMSSTEPAR